MYLRSAWSRVAPHLAYRPARAVLRIVMPLSVLLVPLTAGAQETTSQAAREFAEGQKAFNAGDFRHAAEEFEAAYKHKPHHAPLYNAARARQRAGDSARAANEYARYLKEAPADARDRNTAAASLRTLAAKLGVLEVHAVGLEDLKVDNEPAVEGDIYVNPGAHVVEARKGDKAVQQSPSVEAGQTMSVALVASSSSSSSDPSGGSHTPPPPPPDDTPIETPPAPSSGGWSPVVVVVGSGLTVVGVVLTVASGLDTIAQKTVYSQAQTQENLSAGQSKQTRTNVLLATTVGLGVLTGVAAIWLVDWHEGEHTTKVGLGLGQVLLRGSF